MPKSDRLWRPIRKSRKVQTHIQGQWFLYTTHQGNTYTIVASMLPSKAAFDEVCELMEDKVRAAQNVEYNRAESDATEEKSRE